MSPNVEMCSSKLALKFSSSKIRCLPTKNADVQSGTNPLACFLEPRLVGMKLGALMRSDQDGPGCLRLAPLRHPIRQLRGQFFLFHHHPTPPRAQPPMSERRRIYTICIIAYKRQIVVREKRRGASLISTV